jgi:hypothetical protein
MIGGNAGGDDKMGLSDVAGVFSRYFIVGFFAPSFFVLVALSQTLTSNFLPTVYSEAGNGARIAIIGGAAVLVGLVLLGLNYPILRLFEGYPLRGRWYTKPLNALLTGWQKRRLCLARGKTTDPTAGDIDKKNATWRLDRNFGQDDDRVLPTGFGNAIRAFERHSRIRWGLNAIAAWPLIEMMLSDKETQTHSDAKGDVAFFVNGALLAALGGLVLIVDAVANRASDFPAELVYAVPFVISALCYRASVGAAIQWGEAVRASIDIHRRDLYDKVGLRMPVNFTEEREQLAPALNAALLRGETIPDELATKPPQ